MRNTTLSQLPIAWRGFLYYIAAFCLLLCLSTAAALPAHAEEIADSSSSTSDSTDTDDDLTLGGDITDAYDKYAGGVDSGLDDVKDSTMAWSTIPRWALCRPSRPGYRPSSGSL